MEEIGKIKLLEEMLEMDEGDLKKDMLLTDIENWDSMAKISLIALMDETFNKKLTGIQIKEFNTVADILNEMK